MNVKRTHQHKQLLRSILHFRLSTRLTFFLKALKFMLRMDGFMEHHKMS